MRRLIAAGAAPLLLVAASQATTLRVDGPGDGDGQNGDEFDTVDAALISLDALGRDGIPDVIEIVVDQLTEPSGIGINGNPSMSSGHPTLTDDVSILGDADGNAMPCVIDISAPSNITHASNGAVGIALSPSQEVVIRDITLIPTHTGTNDIDTGIRFGTDDIQRAAGSVVSIENVLVSASAPGNTVMSPATDEVAGGSHFRIGISVDTNQILAGDFATVRIGSCEVVHALDFGLALGFGRMDVDIQDSRFAFAGLQGDLDAYGISAVFIDELDLSLMDVQLDHSDRGFAAGAIVNGGDSHVQFGPGTVISDNRFGIDVSSGNPSYEGFFEVVIAGAPDKPVQFLGNESTCFRISQPNTLLSSISQAIFVSNEGSALNLTRCDLPPVGLPITDTLFAANSRHLTTTTLISSGGSPEIHLERVTMHDLNTFAGYHIRVNQPSEGSPPRLTLEDVIISGTDDETAFRISTAAEVDLNGVGIVQVGPDRIGGLFSINSGTINEIAVTGECPLYAERLPLADASFDVQAELYRESGPGGNPLSGWGEFLGGIEICTSVAGWNLWR